jgi:P pilus assembly chaperone PapD
MSRIHVGRALFSLAILSLANQPASAQQGVGDLLVAPTRLELNNFRGTEVILNNIGSGAATYRVSVEFRRMTPEGDLVEVDPGQVTAAEKTAQEMIAYAPRRVTLEPNQPQSIRVGVRPPPALANGEYRVHLLFRAIPDARPATAAQTAGNGIAIDLRPIYGVTIPVIVRVGQLTAQAGISDARLVAREGRQAVSLTLSRTGDRSLYGDLLVLKPGSSEPVLTARGVAVYTELAARTIVLPTPEGFKGTLAGPATIRLVERTDEGPGKTLAEAQVTLR